MGLGIIPVLQMKKLRPKEAIFQTLSSYYAPQGQNYTQKVMATMTGAVGITATTVFYTYSSLGPGLWAVYPREVTLVNRKPEKPGWSLEWSRREWEKEKGCLETQRSPWARPRVPTLSKVYTHTLPAFPTLLIVLVITPSLGVGPPRGLWVS